ncbi:hypothetical protein [Cohnella fermenti]|uniref:Uncharacterized protein n=1 Tax=Cohnella fermenti TaxID=2565925 RepID=A0A4S4BSL2_9BACL|nr:hypothetical protein [Cohnella fermenti]THF78029.1 hypothetical protein E6C55_15125 [Cohnella fermenti]
MRDGIRQRLIAEIPSIGGRVLESHEDGLTADKPYLVLIQGEEGISSDWTGVNRFYEVWPYEAETAGFAAIDELAQAIVQSLEGNALTDASTGEVFTCNYAGTIGSDLADEERQALTRGLRFTVSAIEAAERAETVPRDAWTEALILWTKSLLGAAWSVYGERWPPGYLAPAVLWRIVGLETSDGNAASVNVRKQLTGHVLGRTPNEQTEAIVRLAEELKRSGKIELDSEQKRFITVRECAAMVDADALRFGQLAVTLSRRSVRSEEGSEEEAPLMREIHYRSAAYGGG